MRKAVAAVLLSLALGSPAVAQEGRAYADAKTGLKVALPPGLVLAGRQDRENYDVTLAVKAGPGGPTAVNADGALCAISFAAAEANAGLTQARINALVADHAWLGKARAGVAALGAVDTAQVFSQGAVKGGEFLISPAAGPNADKVRLYLAMWETPAGRAVVSCAGLKAEASAVEAFRGVRRPVTAG
jgi:methyl coenzyme M reductase alpha subunit